MDETERRAEKYLRSLDLGVIVYEPDGNIPPDFCIDGRIAVEVRRLNQNFENENGSKEGLEDRSFPLWQQFEKLMPTLGPSFDGEGWFVLIDFRRPLEKWNKLRPLIVSQLNEFKSRQVRVPSTLQITPNMKLDLLRREKGHDFFYTLGAIKDDDGGGNIICELERNLRICIQEKEAKIEPYRAKYSEWWLIFANYIDNSMYAEDRQELCSEVMPKLTHGFARIVIIDPRNYLTFIECFYNRK